MGPRTSGHAEAAFVHAWKRSGRAIAAALTLPPPPRQSTERQPPVHIPLSLEQAVEGLLGVKPDPKQPKKKGPKK